MILLKLNEIEEHVKYYELDLQMCKCEIQRLKSEGQSDVLRWA